jgi:hypothetical protein
MATMQIAICTSGVRPTILRGDYPEIAESWVQGPVCRCDRSLSDTYCFWHQCDKIAYIDDKVWQRLLEVNMTRTIEATFDGEVLLLDEPLDLKPNTRVRVTIETSGASQIAGKASQGSLRELFGSVDLGYPTGEDNESIDADLAREYASTNEETP